MLSGGSERVLVAWGANNSKKFIPRLPASILHISASNTHLAVSTADNSNFQSFFIALVNFFLQTLLFVI